ncbi:hypothetical protein EZH22_26650 [Xanthobacter dioxanivorans]|uniref:ImuA protein n=1 Tax=Xanthobacter dioxanivorans TaxID=2528964 RepID=A0A974PNI5_9HYPH|nr:hypothetical protein [Xanthobacter dioxanivorans]QRG06481.1 hypothetical protein EZH22_26650 [Xanthobacter dioxanivorans]
MPSCSTEASRSAADVARLRRTIAAIERGEASPDPSGTFPASEGGAPARLLLGVPQVDGVLGGGLLWGGLHEASAAAEHAGVLGAFALGLAARAVAQRRRPLLVVQQDLVPWEAGTFYAPGLAAFGLSPGALIVVRVRRPQDVLFVMEEGLKCAGLAAVLGEVCAPLPEALTATRRLSLAARGRGVLGLLVRYAAAPEPCAAASRWVVSPLPSPARDGFGGLGLPRANARLVRNRFGPPGAWPLAFAGGHFRLAPDEREARHDPRDTGSPSLGRPALSRPQPAEPFDGPPRTADVA